MATMRCPHCGSPVRIRGQRWECGWCGDSGYLASLPSEQDAPGVELTFMLEFQCQEPEEKEPDLAAHLEQGPNYEGLD